MRPFSIAALLIYFASTAFAQDAAAPVAVPFTQISTGHFLVKVKLNGKGPYNLIFDTGAPMTIIDNRIAKEAGVAAGGGFMPFGAMGEPQSIKKLDLGDLSAKAIPAMVIDHPTVAAFSKYYKKAHGESIDGILGFPFFARFATTVNYQTRELKFAPNGYQPTDLMKSLTQKMLGGRGKPEPKILAAQGYWGLGFAKKTDEEAGVTIETVYPGSPAAKAGLLAGDRLLTLDGRWTDSPADVYAAAGTVAVGIAADLVVKRGTVEKTVSVAPLAGF